MGFGRGGSTPPFGTAPQLSYLKAVNRVVSGCLYLSILVCHETPRSGRSRSYDYLLDDGGTPSPIVREGRGGEPLPQRVLGRLRFLRSGPGASVSLALRRKEVDKLLG